MTTHLHDDTAILLDICRNPENDAPRLAYAKWAEENDIGDGKLAARAQFIRTQCELANLDDNDPKRTHLKSLETTLLKEYGREWSKPLADLQANDITFERGFPHHVKMTPENFLKHAKQLFAIAPIRSMKFPNNHKLSDAICSPHLIHLTALDLSNAGVGAGHIEHWIGHYSQHLANLRSLNLARNHISEPGIVALVGSPFLSRLTELNLCGNYIGETSAKILASSPLLSQLRSLDLSYNPDIDLHPIQDSYHLHNLRHLNVAHTNSHPEALLRLLKSRMLPQLETVNYDDNISDIVSESKVREELARRQKKQNPAERGLA